MEQELLSVLEQIEREKGIKKEELLKMIETALISAFRKHSGKTQDVEAKVDIDTGSIKAWIIKKVVEKVENSAHEISLFHAKEIKSNIKLGSDIKIKIETDDFGRIAAQTAKQVIIQRIRETERENLYNEMKQKEKMVLNGSVQRFVNNNVIVDLGKIEAILPFREQVKSETYRIGERLKVYIVSATKTSKGPQVLVSRTHPELIKRLFELEVPEVYDKTVEIKNIVRDPGVRAKVAVFSHNSRVDPVGACVGVKGSRIRAIIDELRGERIDMINWSDDTIVYIGNSLSPAKVLKVIADNKDKKAEVIIANDQLSLAIGKSGQNVRLAARLTGWHVDIKSEAQKKEAVTLGLKEISSLSGIGEKTAKTLFGGGFHSVRSIVAVPASALTILQGIGPKMAEKIHKAAKEALKK